MKDLYDESGAPIGLQYRTTSYDPGKFDTYYFEKNIFGDIVAVYTDAGVKIGSYVYDAWGNCTVTVASGVTSVQSSVVWNYNPFRYRGYFYDYETGLYYLQSRYYNPATGRFINADGLVSTGTGLLGYNMYIYCNNNPVMCVDPTGMCPGCSCLACMSGMKEDECTNNQNVSNQNSNNNYSSKNMEQRYDEYVAYLAATEIPLTPEQEVLNAKHFAFYKGVPVVKVPFLGTDAFSFGIIFLGSDVDKRLNPETVVAHEWGHSLQFASRGSSLYLLSVAIPSVCCYWLDRAGILSYDYYSSPFEYQANMYAGIQYDDYEPWAKYVYLIYKGVL